MELIVENLGCARGGFPVLRGVSFRLRPGRVLLLRGPNGIGKTTLLRTIAGLQPALGGKMAFDPGQIAYGAHADGLKPTLTAQENLAFWASVHGSDRVAEALAAFGLSGLASRRTQHLSAGQKRRLGLARLLVTGRRLWALDEPTVSLDSAGVSLFAAVVQRHCRAGGMALIATHMDPAIDTAAETGVLDLTRYRASIQAEPRPDEAFP